MTTKQALTSYFTHLKAFCQRMLFLRIVISPPASSFCINESRDFHPFQDTFCLMGEAAFSCKSVFIAVLGHRLVPVALASYQDTAVSPRTARMLRGSADTADGRNPSLPPGMRWREQEVQHAGLPRRGG